MIDAENLEIIDSKVFSEKADLHALQWRPNNARSCCRLRQLFNFAFDSRTTVCWLRQFAGFSRPEQKAGGAIKMTRHVEVAGPDSRESVVNPKGNDLVYVWDLLCVFEVLESIVRVTIRGLSSIPAEANGLSFGM